MGKEWDHGIPGIPFWIEALRVAKPGCHLLAFGGTRTFHRLACAIEDAGWEIRDTLMWVYGSGFPKSESVSLAIDKKACRVKLEAKLGRKPARDEFKAAWAGFRKVIGHNAYTNQDIRGNAYESDRAKERERLPSLLTAPATDAAKQWEGWGTALKPAWEPIIMARKPLEGTVVANVQKWGTGAINVDGCRVGAESHIVHGKEAGKFQPTGGTTIKDYHSVSGRWPANLIHDGSEEVLELFPNSSITGNRCIKNRVQQSMGSTPFMRGQDAPEYTDSGSAARFFYCAKASRAEREVGCEGMEIKETCYAPMGINDDEGIKARGRNPENQSRKTKNFHPCVKPLALMRYLCRLVTPPNGIILDPFTGSGTTGMAAKIEGFRFIGIEKEQEYIEIAERRIEATEWRAR